MGAVSEVLFTKPGHSSLSPSPTAHKSHDGVASITWTSWSFLRRVVGTKLTVRHLQSGAAHRFRVQAINEVGAGEWSYPTGPICTNKQMVVMAIKARSIALLWGDPRDERMKSFMENNVMSELQRREVRDVSKYGGEPFTKWVTISDRIEGMSMVATGLLPDTTYAFRVRPLLAEFGETWEDCVSSDAIKTLCTIPGAPCKPEVTRRASNAVVITWEYPLRDNGLNVSSNSGVR